MADFYLKQGDLEPELSVALKLADGSAASLIGAEGVSIRFADSYGVEIFEADAEFTTDGVVTYAWQAGDTDTAGTFTAEFEVDWGSDRPQTYPASGVLVIEIAPRL